MSTSPDPNDQKNISLPAPSASRLLTSFTTFLTLTLHTLLYHRHLYPPETFLTARAYNLPVHQSRHPGVCTWIADAVTAVGAQLRRAAVERVVLAVHAPGQFRVLERWVIDVARFPEWGSITGGSAEGANGADPGGEDDGLVNWTDVNEALRGALRRIAYAAEKMAAPPQGCTFTLAVELRDEASAPIGHPQDWIPSQPSLQPSSKKQAQKQPATVAGPRATPIRSVQAGPLFFECWVEQPDGDEPKGG
ncbi:DNA polymerase zeta processivity subunit-like protein [Hapsidospora chrysogenum ATCC 11550]|uniref:DNA polymerase zeta processivity subunit-like protein n=1 Tax=Hapsidospora chrysogenum (strain ATCC 11550 / CBS 779.69 / DSM 880 / IAM 14645 / JCM 23072 / IMI 49137) TaxID=857340 RepID=A0A086T772_HAPC1|nr:DNA polymerase zeta processivity subunit-like protein [Hapsidospora chrysogenum ATCC 11550]